MWKGLALSAAILAGGSAHAQQGDPLRGAFGVVEAAMTPGEAFAQAELLVSALSALPPERKGVTDTYILAASLWNDPVFESEAREAAAILGRHFDAGDRTIVLSAGTGGTQRAYAAATPNNIQAAIGKIGKTINPAEDLVVVFLTSHGSPDGSVAMQEKNRLGGALRAQHLRASLAQAGVRSKVVIVSACFAGHFILPFSDPDTLVLTAAAADKQSFGCEPSRDWTYFGDALFNHALRGGAGLVEAYDASLGLIAKWEGDLLRAWEAKPASQRAADPRPEPSNPQKGVGDRAALVVAKAEQYGMSVNCAGHLAFALDRARSGRPLKGLADPAALQAAKLVAETRAQSLAGPLQRTPQDVARSISSASASVLKAFSGQADVVTASAGRCAGAG
ncbi:MAG: C13 family peptidase [Alphaproteobacteria bacterium]|nr:C13 family peptidase [Alphaproteobacteria bacterium]